MLIRVIAALVVPMIFASTASAERRPYLGVTEAKRAVARTLQDYTLAGFSERRPRVWVRCHKTGRDTARCRASFSSDRLSGTVRAWVREEPQGYDVRLSALRA